MQFVCMPNISMCTTISSLCLSWGNQLMFILCPHLVSLCPWVAHTPWLECLWVYAWQGSLPSLAHVQSPYVYLWLGMALATSYPCVPVVWATYCPCMLVVWATYYSCMLATWDIGYSYLLVKYAHLWATQVLTNLLKYISIICLNHLPYWNHRQLMESRCPPWGLIVLYIR